MIFLDSNIIIELLNDGAGPGDAWLAMTFARGVADRSLCCNLIVVSEVAAGFADVDALISHLSDLTIEILDMTTVTAFRAAEAHREYRKRGGARSTMLPDFLIAAHAATLGARLMTRDRRLASYFPELTFLTPENDNG